MLAAALAVTGCGSALSPSPTAQSSAQNFRPSELRPGASGDLRPAAAAKAAFDGAVAADDPRAANVARDILLAGGTATDAAVALYFALTVTKPSAASLGASGACLVYDWKANTLRALDFAAPAMAAAPGGRPVMAPPLAPRAMFALHAANGRMRWAQLVTPAETLARFGVATSRALAQELKASEAGLLRDAETRRLFGAASGIGTAVEGQVLMQQELAGMLSAIRQNGPGVLHVGPQARQIADAAAQAGIGMGDDAMRGAVPQFMAATALPLDSHRIGFMPGYDTRGPYQAMLWALLTDRDRLEEAPVAERLHIIADADARAEADFAAALPAGRSRLAGNDQRDKAKAMLAAYNKDRAAGPVAIANPRRADDSGTSFAVADKEGQAVACGFTLYRPFGLGRTLPGTGIFPAVPPTPDQDATALSPAIVWNENTKQVFFAGAGAGFGAPTAVLTTALQTVLGKFKLEAGMGIPRLHHPGMPNAVLIERSVGQDAREDLTSRGHVLKEVERFGPLNAIACADGLPRRADTCEAQTDARGAGLALLPSK